MKKRNELANSKAGGGRLSNKIIPEIALYLVKESKRF